MNVETHTLTARLEDSTMLKVLEGQITLDDTWAPYVQATIRVGAVSSTSITDPRQLKRVILVASRTVAPATVATETRTFDLHIRRRQIHKDGTMTLTLASDEALLVDLRVQSTTQRTDLTTVRQFITWAFTETATQFPTSLRTFTLQPGSLNGSLRPDADGKVFLDAPETYWDVLQPQLQGANLRLWCDEGGKFWLSSNAGAASGSIDLLVSGGRVVDADDTIDRDDEGWADHVMITYLASEATGVLATSEYPWSSGTITKTIHLEMPGRAPFNQFSSEAQIEAPAKNVWTRMLRRGRQAPVQCVSNYSATPGQAASISTPATAAQVGVVQSVTWSFPEGLMTVTTRNLTG